MNKTDLQSLNYKLNAKLWSNLLFFIPNSFFNLEDIKKLDFEKFKDFFFNKLIVLDYSQGPLHFSPKIDNTRYLKKTSELGEIIFLLLEKKGELKDYELSYILDKHFEQAECMLKITNWLNLNKHQLDDLDSNTSGLFLIQFNSYKKHLEDFIRNFYPNKELLPHKKFNTLELIEANFKDLTNNVKISPSNLNTSNLDIQSVKAKEIFTEFLKQNQNEKEQIKVKPKKKTLITEQEAESAILKTIFNIQV